jgi:hypothetical protein
MRRLPGLSIPSVLRPTCCQAPHSTLARAAELLDFNSPQYISGRENSDDPFFAHRPLDYIWRLLCLEEFIETTESILRKS